MSFLSHILGLGPTSQQKNLTNQQAQLAQEQAQMFRDVMPQYMKSLDWFSQGAGLGPFHPSDFGKQTGAMPPYNPSGSQALGSQYSAPNPGGPDASGWQWNPAGMNMPPAPQPVKQDIFGNGAALRANKNGGSGDPVPNAPPPATTMGPNPYGPQKPVEGPTAASPTPQAPTAPFGGSGRIAMHQSQAYNQLASNPQQQSIWNQGHSLQNGPQNGNNYSQGASTGYNNPWMQGQTGGVSNKQLGIWNDPADALRNAQAQDAINHQNYLAQQQLKSALGSRGLEDSSILGAGLTQMNNAANNQYANFRQNLAIGAWQEQANRIAQMNGLMGAAMGMPQTAQQGYGNVSNELMQQQQMNNQLLGGLGQSAGQLYGMFGPNPYAAMMGGGNPYMYAQQAGMI